MKALDPEHWPALTDELGPERCCSLHARHVVATGHGRLWVDRWPAPRAVAAFTGGNMGLLGDPEACSFRALRAIVDDLLGEWQRVFIDPGPVFGRGLVEHLDALRLWPRVLYSLDGAGRHPGAAPGVHVRPLDAEDAEALVGLDPGIAWISDTHDGPESLAASGHAVGAFVSDRLVSVAAVFYLGRTYEEIGVVTDPDHEGRGLSSRCTAVLVEAIRGRGRTPCWSTTPDNRASQRVAEKVGFRRVGEQHHFVAGQPVEGALPLP